MLKPIEGTAEKMVEKCFQSIFGKCLPLSFLINLSFS